MKQHSLNQRVVRARRLRIVLGLVERVDGRKRPLKQLYYLNLYHHSLAASMEFRSSSLGNNDVLMKLFYSVCSTFSKTEEIVVEFCSKIEILHKVRKFHRVLYEVRPKWKIVHKIIHSSSSLTFPSKNGTR